MSLCERFDLRFNVIADRFAMTLKDRYDRKLQQNAWKAGNDDAASVSEKDEEEERSWLNKLDVRTFERTVDEVKWRYYEVATALLKHRGVKRHKILETNCIQRQSVSGGGTSVFDVE
jgi:hypothetical protein